MRIATEGLSEVIRCIVIRKAHTSRMSLGGAMRKGQASIIMSQPSTYS